MVNRMITLELISRKAGWLLCILIVTLNLLADPPELVADEWYEIYKQGISALERGDWEKAVEKFQEALQIKIEPEAQAATSGLTMVDYLPYYYLAQTYLYSGKYKLAQESLQKSAKSGAVAKTIHLPHLEQMLKIAERLVQFSEQDISRKESDVAFEKKLATLQNFIITEKYDQASILLQQLKGERPKDNRIPFLEKWIQSERQKSVLEANRAGLANQADHLFNKGLEYYLMGQYEQALNEFKTAQSLDPNLIAAQSWIQKTEAEMERLKLDTQGAPEETSQPEIIEKIITQTTAPVFVLRSPTKSVSEIRSEHLELSGQAGDDQGIAYIEFTLNGKPLLNSSGELIIVQPQENDDPKKFGFSTLLPLQMGENQIVLTAYDVDSPPHRTFEQFTVIRKPPIYQTTAFGVSVGAILLLGIGGLFISRMVKYRIAIVNKYNPYIAGSPIRNEEMFFGREKLLKRILNTLHNNSLMIHGPRRIGKTSLQHHLKLRLENMQDPEFHFIPVLIDLQGTSEDRFFATLMEDILEVCKSQVDGEISFEFYENKDEYSGRDFAKDLKILLQFLNNKTDKKLRLVLLMDEVDELNKYSDQVNQKLRSVFMKTFAENLVAVMSGSYIRKNWESEGSPWYNFFEEIEIPPFEREDAIELICKPVKGIFSYDHKAVEKILQYSQCKPYIIQRLCINAINRIIEHKRRRVTMEDVEAVASQVLSAAENVH
ncbi:MAG: tetratricopeptide repeat protein [bacterium]